MATGRFHHNGNDYIVTAESLPNGKFITRIDPLPGIGWYIREPDVQMPDPQTGKTITMQGKPLMFDTEKGALDAGEANIKMGMI